MGYGRYNKFDKLKMLCAFLIVCIYAPFPGIIGEYFTALVRIVVLIFFTITGFFYTRKSVVQQIKKVFILRRMISNKKLITTGFRNFGKKPLIKSEHHQASGRCLFRMGQRSQAAWNTVFRQNTGRHRLQFEPRESLADVFGGW